MTDLDELRAELADFAQSKTKSKLAPRDERIIAGFDEIQKFVEQHGRPPQQGEDKDIFERLYAVRLDRLRTLDEYRDMLQQHDHQGLLEGAPAQEDSFDNIEDDDLLAELGNSPRQGDDITDLRHVRSRAEIQAAEAIANREKCENFNQFELLFEQAESDLKTGIRETRRFGKDAGINQGEFFILGGQMVYVAEMGEIYRTPNGESNARMRVIYSNGTESNLLLRSLQRALYKDEVGRRLTDPDAGPLFAGDWEENDVESGTVYVLRSLSSDSYVVEHRDLIHKIGVTGGKIETRIANSCHESSYLLADVEVVATYKLVDINRVKLENLLHRIFAPARLDLTIEDRFGHPVRPREWFLVPLNVIDEAVNLIRDGCITNLVYDPKAGRLVRSRKK